MTVAEGQGNLLGVVQEIYVLLNEQMAYVQHSIYPGEWHT